ncbi:unnamed protein product [Blepharisma stoltei]|uniref:ATP synthase F0 subunit 8 n=1 Tax=Blepharisma stoltei TaxID=1481888 RepID=A0AAU9IL82_9CILI|nr:unnamed protein product [Blepharisma stoltei]
MVKFSISWRMFSFIWSITKFIKPPWPSSSRIWVSYFTLTSAIFAAFSEKLFSIKSSSWSSRPPINEKLKPNPPDSSAPASAASSAASTSFSMSIDLQSTFSSPLYSSSSSIS